MAVTDDPRLCKAYLTCSDYLKSHKAGAVTCSGCAGDFSSHRVISRTIDKHLNPVIEGVLTMAQTETMQAFIGAAIAIRLDFAENAGMDVEGGEVGLLMGLRLMQRVGTVEQAQGRAT